MTEQIADLLSHGVKRWRVGHHLIHNAMHGDGVCRNRLLRINERMQQHRAGHVHNGNFKNASRRESGGFGV